jgi:hypothetical protein
MRHGETLQASLLVQHVHRAPVGKARHGERCHLAQGFLVVGGAGQFHAGVGEKAQVGFGAPALVHQSAHTADRQRPAIFARGGPPHAFEPVDRTIGPVHAVLDTMRTGRERVLESAFDQRPIVHMHHGQVIGRRLLAARNAVDGKHLRRPPPLPGQQVGMERRGRARGDRRLQARLGFGVPTKRSRGCARSRPVARRSKWCSGPGHEVSSPALSRQG